MIFPSQLTSALTSRTSFNDNHYTASRSGDQRICGDYVCAPGEYDKMQQELSQAQRTGKTAHSVLTTPSAPTTPSIDPLPSWNDNPVNQRILNFVKEITTEDGQNYVPIADRIAVFDNDGTLWSEYPMYVQLAFTLDRVKALAPQHPEWKEEQPFKAVLEGDMKTVLSGGEQTRMKLIMTTQTGMTTTEFEQIVKDWLATAKHPRFNKPYTDLVYQPMLPLTNSLAANQ